MADSNITKYALAAAFKKLLETEPFSKISVGDICCQCQMNRKSFYYHFKDKYDLVNWIYYTEFVVPMRRKPYLVEWELLEDLCLYLDENCAFYRKTMSIEGQNSFSEYLRELIVSVIHHDLMEIFGSQGDEAFFLNFYTDAFFYAIKRWLFEPAHPSPREFVSLLKKCLGGVADKKIQAGLDESNLFSQQALSE